MERIGQTIDLLPDRRYSRTSHGTEQNFVRRYGFVLDVRRDRPEVTMSIEGIKFCDLCGGAIYLGDVTAVKIEEDGHLAQLHFHNRHANDCLTQKLAALEDEFAHAEALTQ